MFITMRREYFKCLNTIVVVITVIGIVVTTDI